MTKPSSILGPCFQPYVGPWVEGVPVLWNAYTLEQVVDLLKPISSYFNSISTYGQGTFVWENVPRIQDSNKFNIQAAKSVGLSVSAGCALQGISGDSFNVEWTKCEVDYALSQAVTHGNVIDIVIGDENIFGPNSANQLVEIIKYAKSKRDSVGLSMPITTRQRWDVMAGVNNTTPSYGSTRKALLDIVKSCDRYIYVDMYPYFDQNISNAIGSVTSSQEQFSTAIKSSMTATWSALQEAWSAQGLTTGIHIGETGWPTFGSQPGQKVAWLASINFAQWYMTAINEWMSKNAIIGFLFEAYNEPWKGPSSGLNSESAFGIWKAVGLATSPSSYKLSNEMLKYQIPKMK